MLSFRHFHSRTHRLVTVAFLQAARDQTYAPDAPFERQHTALPRLSSIASYTLLASTTGLLDPFDSFSGRLAGQLSSWRLCPSRTDHAPCFPGLLVPAWTSTPGNCLSTSVPLCLHSALYVNRYPSIRQGSTKYRLLTFPRTCVWALTTEGPLKCLADCVGEPS